MPSPNSYMTQSIQIMRHPGVMSYRMRQRTIHRSREQEQTQRSAQNDAGIKTCGSRPASSSPILSYMVLPRCGNDGRKRYRKVTINCIDGRLVIVRLWRITRYKQHIGDNSVQRWCYTGIKAWWRWQNRSRHGCQLSPRKIIPRRYSREDRATHSYPHRKPPRRINRGWAERLHAGMNVNVW